MLDLEMSPLRIGSQIRGHPLGLRRKTVARDPTRESGQDGLDAGVLGAYDGRSPERDPVGKFDKTLL